MRQSAHGEPDRGRSRERGSSRWDTDEASEYPVADRRECRSWRPLSVGRIDRNPRPETILEALAATSLAWATSWPPCLPRKDFPRSSERSKSSAWPERHAKIALRPSTPKNVKVPSERMCSGPSHVEEHDRARPPRGRMQRGSSRACEARRHSPRRPPRSARLLIVLGYGEGGRTKDHVGGVAHGIRHELGHLTAIEMQCSAQPRQRGSPRPAVPGPSSRPTTRRAKRRWAERICRLDGDDASRDVLLNQRGCVATSSAQGG